MLEQKEIISLIGERVNNATVFEKFKTVLARKASPSEKVVTYTQGIKETQNVAYAGDYVVRNSTESQEEYIVESVRFNQRYQLQEEVDKEWKRYKALGTCRGIVVDNEILEILDQKQEFTFVAPWGEGMICKTGDMLVCPTPEGEVGEIYRIGKEEFEETYQELK